MLHSIWAGFKGNGYAFLIKLFDFNVLTKPIDYLVSDTFEGNNKSPINYYLKDDEIKESRYSPENSAKNIYTDFINQ